MNNRQTLIFAVYVPIGNMSPQRAREQMAQLIEMYKEDPFNPNQYNEKYLWLPTKTDEARIELLYPMPFLTEEQAEKLHEKYYAKYQEAINKIGDL